MRADARAAMLTYALPGRAGERVGERMKIERWRWIALLAGLLGACSEEPSAGPPGTAGASAGAAGSATAGSTAVPGINPAMPMMMMPIGGAPAAGSSAIGAGTGASAAAGVGGVASTAGAGGISASAGSNASAGAGAGGSAAPGNPPLQVKITARAVPSNGENHVCVVVPLANTERAWITSIHASLTNGSHHLIVDRMPVGTPTQSQTQVCPPTMGGDSTRLIIAQQRETVLHMPPGTGLPIEPQQPVFLQLHYINLDDKPIDVEGVVEVTLADAQVAPPIEVQSLFTGATNLQLPSGQAATGEFFMKVGAAGQKPWHVFAITSHTHSLGIKSTIERVASATAPNATPIHESLDWHEPPLTRLEPPLVFTGADGLRLRCQFMNTTDHDVGFGTRFEDEMCFLWLYYYEQ